jgi:adenine-specific DNA-methyltransferase
LTELIWGGKYDQDGRKIAPLRVRLPFQTVETVNESAQQRQHTLDLFSSGRPPEWRNRLIWGDKKYVLPALLDEFAGQVNLIYIDPPFNTGQDFSFRVSVADEDFTKAPSIIEQKAYRDTWGVSPQERTAGKTHLDKYLQWFYETIILLRELLAEDGTAYIHLDWNMGHYAKVVADEVFGKDRLRNEIIWYYTNKLGTGGNTFDKHHDTLLVYVKGEQWQHTPLMRPVKKQKLQPVTQKINGERIWQRDEDGKRVYEMGRPETKVGDVWEVPYINPVASERLGYDTQKPEKLLEQVITASSKEGDLVLDCFVGSGTTAVKAEQLGRRWIACDLGRFAIHTTRKRLLSLPQVKPFIVQNLGKYERQLWQAAEFGESAEERTLAYRHFILNLSNARPITGYSWLHGVRAGRMVHVGAVDSPVSPSDVTQIATEFKRAVGTGKDAPANNGVDVLGWDFAFELNEVAKQQAAQANISMRFLRIPREVLEKKAVEQGDIKFFELAALSVNVQQKKRAVSLTLTDFVIPPDDVPEDIRQTITNWEQWIDYWAVDWNNRGDTFHNEWQDYRTRSKRELQKMISHTYEEPGTYIVMIKAIDILGNDTTKTIKIEVR